MQDKKEEEEEEEEGEEEEEQGMKLRVLIRVRDAHWHRIDALWSRIE